MLIVAWVKLEIKRSERRSEKRLGVYFYFGSDYNDVAFSGREIAKHKENIDEATENVNEEQWRMDG